MGAYKQFNSQDLIISPFEVNKSFYYEGSKELIEPDVEINRFLGRNGDYLLSGSVMTGTISAYQIPQVLVYDSIKQLYYQNYISGSGGFTQDAITSSIVMGATPEGNRRVGQVQNTNYYDYPSTSLWPSRSFPTPSPTTASVPIGVISIPSKLWGDYIQPNSFLLQGPTGSIKDDGEGRLLYKTTASNSTYSYIEGNIIYEHGIVTLFGYDCTNYVSDFYGTAIYGTSLYGGVLAPCIEDLDWLNAWVSDSDITMSFSSSYTMYETQYKATISENEFNYTLNPSSITGSQIPTVFPSSSINWENTASSGVRLSTVTGSYFSPYITTVGLYDEDFQLLAIGKLAKPIQSSQTTDTTILVNIDR
jgi:hypothetical protein